MATTHVIESEIEQSVVIKWVSRSCVTKNVILLSRDEHGQDCIKTEANFGRIRTGSDCNFFEN